MSIGGRLTVVDLGKPVFRRRGECGGVLIFTLDVVSVTVDDMSIDLCEKKISKLDAMVVGGRANIPATSLV